VACKLDSFGDILRVLSGGDRPVNPVKRDYLRFI